MRKIGYTLLILGFLWLIIWCAFSVGPLTRFIGMEKFKKYPDGMSYSGEDVRHAIRSVLAEYHDNAHGVTLPATLMLVGGMLLDFAGRRK